MFGFDFSQLSLGGVQAASAGSVLPPGRYVCKVREAKIVDTKDGTGKVLNVSLTEVDGKGAITARLNVFNKSPKAMEIGLGELKALLVHGGHPDPDNIGQHGIGSLKGLTVGVFVKADSYNGEQRSQVGGFFDPATHTAPAAKAAPAAAGSIGADGDIPF